MVCGVVGVVVFVVPTPLEVVPPGVVVQGVVVVVEHGVVVFVVPVPVVVLVVPL